MGRIPETGGLQCSSCLLAGLLGIFYTYTFSAYRGWYPRLVWSDAGIVIRGAGTGDDYRADTLRIRIARIGTTAVTGHGDSYSRSGFIFAARSECARSSTLPDTSTSSPRNAAACTPERASWHHLWSQNPGGKTPGGLAELTEADGLSGNQRFSTRSPSAAACLSKDFIVVFP